MKKRKKSLVGWIGMGGKYIRFDKYGHCYIDNIYETKKKYLFWEDNGKYHSPQKVCITIEEL